MALSSILNGLKIGLAFANPVLVPASLSLYGQGSSGTYGVPAIAGQELPTFGNAAFGFGVNQAMPGAVAVLLISSAAAEIQIGAGADVRLAVDLGPAAASFLVPMPVSAFGAAFFTAPIPHYGSGLEGFTAYCQWAIVGDPNAGMTLYGVPLALTSGLSITLGI
jgi:hypothetical protein